MSLPATIASQGASFGCLLWVLSMTAAAMAVALTLSWRPQWLRLVFPWRSQAPHAALDRAATPDERSRQQRSVPN